MDALPTGSAGQFRNESSNQDPIHLERRLEELNSAGNLQHLIPQVVHSPVAAYINLERPRFHIMLHQFDPNTDVHNSSQQILCTRVFKIIASNFDIQRIIYQKSISPKLYVRFSLLSRICCLFHEYSNPLVLDFQKEESSHVILQHSLDKLSEFTALKTLLETKDFGDDSLRLSKQLFYLVNKSIRNDFEFCSALASTCNNHEWNSAHFFKSHNLEDIYEAKAALLNIVKYECTSFYMPDAQLCTRPYFFNIKAKSFDQCRKYSLIKGDINDNGYCVKTEANSYKTFDCTSHYYFGCCLHESTLEFINKHKQSFVNFHLSIPEQAKYCPVKTFRYLSEVKKDIIEGKANNVFPAVFLIQEIALISNFINGNQVCDKLYPYRYTENHKSPLNPLKFFDKCNTCLQCSRCSKTNFCGDTNVLLLEFSVLTNKDSNLHTEFQMQKNCHANEVQKLSLNIQIEENLPVLARIKIKELREQRSEILVTLYKSIIKYFYSVITLTFELVNVIYSPSAPPCLNTSFLTHFGTLKAIADYFGALSLERNLYQRYFLEVSNAIRTILVNEYIFSRNIPVTLERNKLAEFIANFNVSFFLFVFGSLPKNMSRMTKRLIAVYYDAAFRKDCYFIQKQAEFHCFEEITKKEIINNKVLLKYKKLVEKAIREYVVSYEDVIYAIKSASSKTFCSPILISKILAHFDTNSLQSKSNLKCSEQLSKLITKQNKEKFVQIENIELFLALPYIAITQRPQKPCYGVESSNLYHSILHILYRFHSIKNLSKYSAIGMELSLQKSISPVLDFISTKKGTEILKLFELTSTKDFPRLVMAKNILVCNNE